VLEVVGASVVAGEVDVELLGGVAVVGGAVAGAAVVDVAGAAGAAGGAATGPASRCTTAVALTAVSRAARPGGVNVNVTLTFVPSGTPAPMSNVLVT
jgi:hypothetical protein